MDLLLAALLALLLWAGGTALILRLDGLAGRRGMAGATLLLAAALWGLWATAGESGPAGAALAFGCAILAWGWAEVAFLSGWLTGPERAPCPPGRPLGERFRRAVGALWHHELSLLALLAAAAWLTAGGENRVGAWTLALLWVLRLSAKLNLFLGVRSRGAALLPEGLRHLASHFGAARDNPLWPLSLLASAGLAAWLLAGAAGAAEPGERVALVLLGTLAALGALEHVLMAVPLCPTTLWGWSLRPRPREGWSAELPGRHDPAGLEGLLHAVAGGLYGAVDELRGEARAGEGWVRFSVSDGRPSLAPASPREGFAGRVEARGRVDGPRLSAAFAACAAR